jgi:hypothetical protein
MKRHHRSLGEADEYRVAFPEAAFLEFLIEERVEAWRGGLHPANTEAGLRSCALHH